MVKRPEQGKCVSIGGNEVCVLQNIPIKVQRHEIKRSSLGMDERLVANVEGEWLAVGMNEAEMWMAPSMVTTSTQSKSKPHN